MGENIKEKMHEWSFQTPEEEKIFYLLSAKFMDEEEEDNARYAGKREILFWLPEAAHMWDSMNPLFYYCIRGGVSLHSGI